MKICKICETEVEDNVSVCPVCDNAFDGDEAIIETDTADIKSESVKSTRPLIIVIIILVTVLIIGAICLATVFTYRHTETPKPDSTTGNAVSTNTTTTTQNTTIEIILNEPYYIKYNAEKEYVSMYRESNTDSEVITRFSPNGKKAIKVTLISKDDNSLWKVKYKGKTGYVHKDNLVKDKQKATKATTTTTEQPETTAQNTRAYQTYTTYIKPQTKKKTEMVIIEEY